MRASSGTLDQAFAGTLLKAVDDMNVFLMDTIYLKSC